MRTDVVAVLAMTLVMAGCTSSPPASPVTPTSSGGAWTTWSGAYVAQGLGYGFVAVDDEGWGPATPFVAVDDSGRVLYFLAKHRVESDPDPPATVEFAAGLSSWRSVVAPLLADGRLFDSNQPRDAYVTQVRTATLSSAEWTEVHAALEDGLARARDPEPRTEGPFIADGGTTVLRTRDRIVSLDDNDDGGGGWTDVDRQMDVLRAWIVPNG